MRIILGFAVVLSFVLLGGGEAVLAKDCPPNIIGAPGNLKRVKEVKIISGEDCLIRWVEVRNGNVQGSDAGNVRIRDSVVKNGDVQLDKNERSVVRDTLIKNGNVQVKESGFARVDDNVAANGDIQVEKNDEARVRRNTASGNIQCVDNGNLVSNGNDAGGDLEGCQ